jgi:hypothetical protein
MLDDGERRALANIEKFGCHNIHVFAEDGFPPFTYSIGLATTRSGPDLCIVGLEQRLAGSVINHYAERLLSGERFVAGHRYTGFLEGFDVCFEPAAQRHYVDCFGWAIWYYRGSDFVMNQLIYPSINGSFPWEEGASDDYRAWQTILTEDGHTAFDRT